MHRLNALQSETEKIFEIHSDSKEYNGEMGTGFYQFHILAELISGNLKISKELPKKEAFQTK